MTSEPVVPHAPGILEALAGAGRRVVLAVTGGGSAAIPALVARAGASRVVEEVLVPYSRAAVDALLGGPQETYCSSRAARRLAMACWERCVRFGAPPEAAVGVGCTAALATREPKRGDHRVIVAVQTLTATAVTHVVLAKGARTRTVEESVAAMLVVDRLAGECGAAGAEGGDGVRGVLLPGEAITGERVRAAEGWSRLLARGDRLVALTPATAPVSAGRAAILPGSFDPLHDGHRAMAAIAARITGLPVAWEMSVWNVDKPALDHVEIARRCDAFADSPAWLTAAPTFTEKLDLFPGAVFVIGADTYLRLWDPRYYGGCAERAASAVDRIAREAAGLVVFGRVRDGTFVDPAAIPAPPALRAIATFVDEKTFRDDVSSTRLRAARAASPE